MTDVGCKIKKLYKPKLKFHSPGGGSRCIHVPLDRAVKRYAAFDERARLILELTELFWGQAHNVYRSRLTFSFFACALLKYDKKTCLFNSVLICFHGGRFPAVHHVFSQASEMLRRRAWFWSGASAFCSEVWASTAVFRGPQ